MPVTADQFLDALAQVESSNNPQAWGDGGRAMGRWQVHPDRLWQEMHTYQITPQLGETWDHLVSRVLRAIFNAYSATTQARAIAMYWHLGNMSWGLRGDWDHCYADKFTAALNRALGGAS